MKSNQNIRREEASSIELSLNCTDDTFYVESKLYITVAKSESTDEDEMPSKIW